jgi:hypothetical protein
MRIPRWLVISMLNTSLLAVLAAAGWWWVTWPDRTARQFVELIAAGNLEQAQSMMGPPETIVLFPPRNWSEVEPESRSVTDLLSGTRKFRTSNPAPFTFTVQRGRIVERWPVFLWADRVEYFNGRHK